MRGAGRLVAAIALLAVACTPVTSKTPIVTPTPSASPTLLSGSAVTPPVGYNAILGWDGVDNRVMLVSPIENHDLHRIGIGVWTLVQAGWQPMPAPPQIANERGFQFLTLAYDSDRHVEILFALTAEPYRATTVSEWDGRSWRNIASPKPPNGFNSGAYSPDLHAVVGIADFVYPSLDRTWLYNGTEWRVVKHDGLPNNHRGFIKIAYDTRRHAIIGLEALSYVTWLFDGTWTQIQAVPPTPIGYGPATAFDTGRGLWVVFGGAVFSDSGSLSSQNAETWTGNGTSWTRLTPSVSPAVRYGSQLAWDPQLNRAVLFGGLFNFCCDVVYNDTWELKGKTWRKVLDAPPVAIASQLPAADPCVPSSSYGLLIAFGKLELVDTCGKVAASAPAGPPSVQACSTGGLQAVLQPPASATRDKVFFRDGDSKIRSLTPDGQTEDVTTVPGGPTTISFFSVSPDDKRIAVAVEDLSGTDAIKLRVYVEDLRGAGHHVDIYSTSLAKQAGKTLWPMGWHGGLLALALVTACAPDPTLVSPSEWHLVDSATGARKRTIRDDSCVLGRWPTEAGDTCTVNGSTAVYNWLGGKVWVLPIWNFSDDMQSGLSPSGQRVFVSGSARPQCMANEPGTCIVEGAGTPSDPRRTVLADGKFGCLWIDEDHVLAPDAIIEMPSKLFPESRYTPVIPLGHSGACAGRFPGSI